LKMFSFGKKKSRKAHHVAHKSGGKKKPFGGIVIVPDEKLGAIIGKKPLPPSKMTKAIWVYIKKHRLMKR